MIPEGTTFIGFLIWATGLSVWIVVAFGTFVGLTIQVCRGLTWLTTKKGKP